MAVRRLGGSGNPPHKSEFCDRTFCTENDIACCMKLRKVVMEHINFGAEQVALGQAKSAILFVTPFCCVVATPETRNKQAGRVSLRARHPSPEELRRLEKEQAKFPYLDIEVNDERTPTGNKPE